MVCLLYVGFLGQGKGPIFHDSSNDSLLRANHGEKKARNKFQIKKKKLSEPKSLYSNNVATKELFYFREYIEWPLSKTGPTSLGALVQG